MCHTFLKNSFLASPPPFQFECCGFAQSVIIKQVYHSQMSLGTLYSQNQQQHALSRNDKTPRCMSQVFPFVPSLARLIFAVVLNGCLAQLGPLSDVLKKGMYLLLFLLCMIAVMLVRPQLKAWCPSAGDRPICTEVAEIRVAPHKAHYVRCYMRSGKGVMGAQPRT